MRRFIILIFALIVLCLVVSGADLKETDQTQYLVIKGYKIGKTGEGVELVITDAITESLEVIDGTTPIDISEHVGALRGNISKGVSIFSEQIIFSYRASGYSEGSFQLDIDFEPFILQPLDSGDTVLGEGNINDFIDASWELGHLSYSFPDYSSDNAGGDFIGLLEGNNTRHNDKADIEGKDGRGRLATAWYVSDGNNDGAVPRWIQRGAVALTLSDDGYTNAAIGDYRATVKVTLSQL